jgi:hypothetical protein
MSAISRRCNKNNSVLLMVTTTARTAASSVRATLSGRNGARDGVAVLLARSAERR